MSKNASHALYIHWPFCKKKCPYCDFNSHVREVVDESAWHDALLAELRWYHDKADKRPLSSIFFGGGTPSLMPPSIAEALILEAEKLFGFAPDIEITLEANPTSTENAKLQDLRSAGVNRLSTGIQSLHPQALKFLGREHSVDEALQALEMAARIFPRYSFDLSYALPDQRLSDWETELQQALTYAGDHLSLYQLTIEAGTQFFHHHKSGKLIMPEEELAAEFYEATQAIMEAHHMPAYEISNHAKAGGNAKHNVHIWRGRSYLGIGPGAHGRMDAADGNCYATYNLRSPEAWIAQESHGNEVMEKVNASDRQQEQILMGLRLRAGLQIDTSRWPTTYLEALREEGLIEFNTQQLIPTKNGRMVLNRLTEGLVENLR